MVTVKKKGNLKGVLRIDLNPLVSRQPDRAQVFAARPRRRPGSEGRAAALEPACGPRCPAELQFCLKMQTQRILPPRDRMEQNKYEVIWKVTTQSKWILNFGTETFQVRALGRLLETQKHCSVLVRPKGACSFLFCKFLDNLCGIKSDFFVPLASIKGQKKVSTKCRVLRCVRDNYFFRFFDSRRDSRPGGSSCKDCRSFKTVRSVTG
jgi:hypothetical protein